MRILHRLLASIGMAVCLSVLATLSYAQAPCTPTVTTKTSVLLAWDKAVQPAGVTELAYVLEWKEDSGPWIAVTPPALSAVQYVDTVNVGKTTTYRLRVQARLADGTTALSDYAAYGTPQPCVQVVSPTLLMAPTNLRATPQ